MRRAGRERVRQLQFECAQLEQKLEFEKKMEEARKSNMGQVAALAAPVKSDKLPKLVITKFSGEVKSDKLPKLVITKFSGELTDWPHFWNQFEA